MNENCIDQNVKEMLKGQYVSMNSNIYKFRDSQEKLSSLVSQPKRSCTTINQETRSVSAACIYRKRAESSDMRRRNLLNEVGSVFRLRADKDHDEESRIRASQKYLIQSFKNPSRLTMSEKNISEANMTHSREKNFRVEPCV